MISDLDAINERLPAGKLFTLGLQHVLMMYAGAALSQEIRDRLIPDAAIEASTNVLVDCNLQGLMGRYAETGRFFRSSKALLHYSTEPGLTENEAKAQGVKVRQGHIPVGSFNQSTHHSCCQFRRSA